MGISTFPKFGNKHSLKPLYSAGEYFATRHKTPETVSSRVIFIYQRKFKNALIKRLGLKRCFYPYKLNSQIKTYTNAKKRVMVAVLPIGAPLTATTAEELHALGANEFIIIGAAGAIDNTLQIGEIVLCSKSVRDEGTSHHYIKNSLYVNPSKALTQKLAVSLKNENVPFRFGASWTIDAPYAETKTETLHYRKKGVLTVEMESAALFAVAKKRNFSAGAIFIISDILGEKWTGFKIMQKDYNLLADVAKKIF